MVAGLLGGAAIGNKLVFLIERPDVWQRLLAGELAMPGQSIVGGLIFSTALTLFVIPVAYLLFDRLLERARRRRHAHKFATAEAGE